MFELPDAVAKVLIDGGTCVKADPPDRPVVTPIIDEPSPSFRDDEKPVSTDGSDDVAEGAVDDVLDGRGCALSSLKDVSAQVQSVLKKTGYTTVGGILDATVDDLVALRGIGVKTAETLKNAAVAFIDAG